MSRSTQKDKTVVVFEYLSNFHVFAVLWYWLSGKRIYFHQVGMSTRDTWWFRKLTASQKLLPINLIRPLYTCIFQGLESPLDIVDEIYENKFANHSLVSKLVRTYDSQSIHTAFKKGLVTELERYCFYSSLKTLIRDTLSQSERLIFVPRQFGFATPPAWLTAYLESFDKPGSDGRPLVYVCIWGKILAAKTTWKRKARAWMFGIHAALSAMAQSLVSPSKISQEPDNFEFAVTIMSSVPEVARGSRGPEFLMDGDRIRPDNTVIVPLVRLTKDQIQVHRDKGFAVADSIWRTFISQSNVPVPSLRILGRSVLIIVHSMIKTFSSPSWLVESAFYMAKDYWIWNGFSQNYPSAHFVTHADFGLRHIARNIILGQHNIQTWFYVDSLNTGMTVKPDGTSRRNPGWSFLKYDKCISWNDRHIEYFKLLHKQEIGEYIAVGCLWSEHVREMRGSPISLSFANTLSASGYKPGMKLVAAFDTSFGLHTIADFKDGLTFLQDMEKLVQDFPEIVLMFKEKKDRKWLGFDTTSRFQGSSEGMDEMLQHLESVDRFCFFGYDSNPSEILAACDLAISYPFTSTTVEVLGAGGMGIYYDPTGKWAGASYEQIPNLVVAGYDDLRNRVHESLYETSESEHQKYLDQRIKGVLDPYMDGMALSRFRDLLCGEPVEAPPPFRKPAKADAASAVNAD